MTPATLSYLAKGSTVFSVPSLAVVNGQFYQFQQWNNGGNTSQSISVLVDNYYLLATYAPVSFTIDTVNGPSFPSSITTQATYQAITLEWSAPVDTSGVEWYRIYYRLIYSSSSFGNWQSLLIPTNTYSWELAGLFGTTVVEFAMSTLTTVEGPQSDPIIGYSQLNPLGGYVEYCCKCNHHHHGRDAFNNTL